MRINVPLTPGDIFDRLTILRLKGEHCQDKFGGNDVRANAVAIEFASIRNAFDAVAYGHMAAALPDDELQPHIDSLLTLNTELWQLEDRIRTAIVCGDISAIAEFATKIVETNDERSRVKSAINVLFGIGFTADDKQYKVNE